MQIFLKCLLGDVCRSQGSVLRRALVLDLISALTVLKLNFEQGSLPFHFALGLVDYDAGSGKISGTLPGLEELQCWTQFHLRETASLLFAFLGFLMNPNCYHKNSCF